MNIIIGQGLFDLLRIKKKQKNGCLARGAQAGVVHLSDGTVWGTSCSPNVPLSSIVYVISSGCESIVTFTLNRNRYVDDNYRTELSGRMAGVTKEMEYGRQYSVDFTLVLPPDWRSDNTHEIVFQLHHVPDADEVAYPTSPPFAIRVINNSIYATYSYSTAKQSWSNHNRVSGESGQLAYASAGKAYRFHLDLKLSRGHLGTGSIRIAVDDVPRFSYDGPFGYDDDTGPYVKFGIYKSPWRPENDLYTSTDVRKYIFNGITVNTVAQ